MGWAESQIEDAGDFFQEEIIDPISDVGSEIDDFVNEEIPGGWGTVAALTGAAYYGLPGFGTEGLAAAEAEFIAADAAQLANQGLSTAQVTQTLTAAGVPTSLAESAATLAGMGLSEAEIIANLGQTMPLSSVPSTSTISVQDALRGANLANQLFGGQQPTMPQMGQPGQAGKGAGAVDYNELLSLLSRQAQQPGLLGTQFQPQGTNIADFINAQRISSLLG